MFRRLLKIQLLSFWSTIVSRSRGKTRSAAYGILIGLVLLYGFGCLVFVFAMTFQSLCAPLVQAGLDWLYFAVAASIAFAISFLMSLFSAESQLYEAKDTTLLLTMPIRSSTILASRMVALWIWIFATELLVMVPAIYIYGSAVPFTIFSAIGSLVTCLFLPLLVLTLDCLCGWLLALLNAHTKRKNIATTLFSVVLILFYFRIYSRLNEYVQQLIVESVAIAGHIRTVFPPLYHLGNAMTGQSWASLAFFLLCTVGPFLLVYWILVRSFARIATARRSLGTVKYKEHALKVHSPLTALVQKELARFTSTPMYMLNASMGLLLSLIGSGFLLFKGRDVLEGITSIPELSTFVAPLMTVILCLLAGMNTISAPSLSLEGRTLWLPQSLPVKGSQVLLSKAYLHMIISLPGAILAALVVVFVCHMGILDAMLCFLVPVLMHIFQALLGVVTNIRFHRFDWINETVAVKQSISVMIGMCANFGVLAAWIVLYIFVFSKYLSAQLYLGVFGIFIAAICVILFRYLVGKGSEKFFTMG